WKYGKEEPPAEVFPKSIEQAKAEEDLVRKARAGLVTEKKKEQEKKAPPRSENLRMFNVFVDGDFFEVGVDEVGGTPLARTIRQIPAIAVQTESIPREAPKPVEAAPKAAPPEPAKAPEPAAPKPAPVEAKGTPLSAPMPGMIVGYKKKVGDEVAEGETVVILEAMKMENALPAPVSGVIKSINYNSGDSVAKNAVLCMIG
ncbi:MAG: biotin/lipoyl-containing protein, partial [Thermodesulfobacteriota bacterium]